jgi:predicted transcriptional regulator
LLLNENNLLENKELHISYAPLKKDDSREHRIISLIKNNPHIKLEDIASELGVSLRTVKSLIAALTQNNKIVRVDGKKYGYWKINE